MRLRVVLTMPGDVKNLKEPVVQNWRIHSSNGDGSTPDRMGWLASKSSLQVFN